MTAYRYRLDFSAQRGGWDVPGQINVTLAQPIDPTSMDNSRWAELAQVVQGLVPTNVTVLVVNGITQL